MTISHTILRFIVAFLVITYGCAKLNGSQFTILASELDRPMGQVSGFWLTWYYFGYSPLYGNIIAIAQVLGGFLLTFRRTTMLGACLLLPIITNIVLVDIFFAIDLGALLVALFIEIALLLILRPYALDLYDLFWVSQGRPQGAHAFSRISIIGKHAIRLLVILVPLALTYWIANYTNRNPTPIDGTWDVIEFSQDPTAVSAPSTIFFERNRAHLTVFKHKDGSYQWHHFEVDPAAHTITIWQEWLRKGTKLFDGNYDLSAGELHLRGKPANDAEESTIVLKRRS